MYIYEVGGVPFKKQKQKKKKTINLPYTTKYK